MALLRGRVRASPQPVPVPDRRPDDVDRALFGMLAHPDNTVASLHAIND
jgi:hypothetical protein